MLWWPHLPYLLQLPKEKKAPNEEQQNWTCVCAWKPKYGNLITDSRMLEAMFFVDSTMREHEKLIPDI